MQIFAVLLAFYFATVLMVAGLGKLKDIRSFEAALRIANLLPISFVKPLSILLPLIEIALALSLISGFAGVISAGINIAVHIAFLCYKIILFRRKLPTECGCFGGQHHNIDLSSIVVAIIWILLAGLYFGILSWLMPVASSWRQAIMILMILYAVFVLSKHKARIRHAFTLL